MENLSNKKQFALFAIGVKNQLKQLPNIWQIPELFQLWESILAYNKKTKTFPTIAWLKAEKPGFIQAINQLEENLANYSEMDSIFYLSELQTMAFQYNFKTKMKEMIEEFKNSKDEELIREAAAKIKNYSLKNFSEDIIKPYTGEDFENDVKSTEEGLKTGFSELDQYIRFRPATLNVIAGRPGHGKTTFMFNILLNQLRLYPDKSFFFFSYEETKRQIALKMITNISEVTLKEDQNTMQIEKFFREGNQDIAYEDQVKLKRAKAIFNDQAIKKKLFIIDIPLEVLDLKKCLEEVTKGYNVGGVFIDYVQKVKTKEPFGNRQMQIQYISNVLLETAKDLNIPIIIGAQLNRNLGLFLHNLRECGDLEQDASITVGIENQRKREDEETRKKKKDEEDSYWDKILFKVMKNRNGIANKSFYQYFNAPVLKFDRCDKVLTERERKQRQWDT